jgi:hypothetical protein
LPSPPTAPSIVERWPSGVTSYSRNGLRRRAGVALKSTSGVEERNDVPSLEIRAAISFPFTKFFKLQQVSKQPNLPS